MVIGRFIHSWRLCSARGLMLRMYIFTFFSRCGLFGIFHFSICYILYYYYKVSSARTIVARTGFIVCVRRFLLYNKNYKINMTPGTIITRRYIFTAPFHSIIIHYTYDVVITRRPSVLQSNSVGSKIRSAV